MRYLLLILVVLAGIWWIRQLRGGSSNQSNTSQSDAQIMVPCAHCGVHTPEKEIVYGKHGAAYCSKSHQQQHES